MKIWVMSKPWFWKNQSRLKRAAFRLEVSRYKQNSSLFNVRANSKILLALSWLGAKSFLWVFSLVFLLWCAEVIVRNDLNLLPILSDADKAYHVEQLRLYAQLLTAIFSIYFATIGIILSAGHTRLRRDIIQLLTAEQVGSVYSKIVVFSASFCVAATSLPVFGFELGCLTFVVATLLMLTTALTLFPLGQRLFNFFDLIPLVESELLPNIAKHIDGAANNKSSASLANHHSKEASRLLDQLKYIDDRIKADVVALETNLPALTDNYARLLLNYLQRKHEIDQKSYWFPRRRRHLQWFFAGDSATTMALNTGSQLTPEETPDFNWLETEITQKLKSHIELAFKEKNYDLALSLLGRLSSRISIYSKEFHFDIGMREIEGIRGIIETAVSQESYAPTEAQKHTIIAISDTLVALGSNLCLETLRRLITFEKELELFFAIDDWTTESMRKLPSFLQVETAFIIERLKFEQSVEGRRLSQPKYLQQLVIQKLLTAYGVILPIINDFQQKQIPDFAQALLKAKMPEAATQVILSSLHIYWKMPRWFEELSTLLKKYYGYEHYNDKQYALPRIDTDIMAKGYADARDKAFAMLGHAALFEHVFSHKHDVDLPDHFGQIYYELAGESVRALEQNQSEKFKRLISTFLPLAMLASDSKFPDPELHLDEEFRLHLVSTVLQDLASVMGYAILYGEYHSNPKLSKIALDTLFAWIDKAKDKRQYMIRMLRLADARSFSWSASPRDIIRINWKMAFEHRSREDGFGDRMSYRRTEHPNKVVNEFLNSYSDASHLFFALKVVPLIGQVDFELDHQITDLARRLAEET